MIFTQEQINEIKQRLSLSGIKDSELDKLNLLEHPLTGKEVIAIVKDGENLRISVEDLYEEFAKYTEQSEDKEDFFNVSVYLGRLDPEFENAAKPCTLEEAINACPPHIRRAGQTISFLDSHNMKWKTYQYIGTKDDDWGDIILFENHYQVLQDQIDDVNGEKQDILVSGENIKTINGESILGSGNIDIQGGGTVDAYTKTESDERYVKSSESENFTTQEKNKLHDIQDRANYQDVVWPYNGDTLFKTDEEEMLTAIVTAQEILAAAHGVTDTQLQTGLQALQQQINELSARLTGVAITVVPTTATVGQQSSFAINVTTTAEASAITLYRGETQIYTSDTAGTSYSYTDTFTPATAGTFKYKVVATIGGITKENEISVSVSKQNAGIGWSYNNATVYTGYSGNQYPTLSNPNNLAITYESSNENVATVNASGVVTLVGAGSAQISAIFAGNGTYNASTVRYSLNVIQDAVSSLAWSGGSLSPTTLVPNGTATFTKGTVIATYLSGKTENVSSLAVASAQRGVISGTTYTAPATAGNDVISVMYAGVTAATKINVTVAEEPKLNVYLGHGATYGSATFTNTGEALHNNQSVTINTSNGDYLFVKVDKRDTVNNLYMHVEGGGYFEWQQIELGAAVTDGDYKYYPTTNAFREFVGLQFVINKV